MWTLSKYRIYGTHPSCRDLRREHACGGRSGVNDVRTVTQC